MNKLIEDVQKIVDNKPPKRIGMLNEAGLARLITRISDKEGNVINDFGVITAFRDKYDIETNLKRNRELIDKFNTSKLGSYYLSGHWQEKPDELKDVDWDVAYEQGKTKDVVEDSMLVVRTDAFTREEFINTLVSLGNEYDQDAISIGLVGEGIFNYFKGSPVKIGTKVTLGKISQAFSQMKKKPNVPFVFEGIRQPDSNSSRWVFENYGIKYLFLFGCLILLSGCVTQKTVTVREVVLLPEERIFTVPQGQKIDVLLDGKPLSMTFPSDMKLVSPSTLVRQEEKLNDQILQKTQLKAKNNKILGILGTIFTIISSGLIIWRKKSGNSTQK